MPPTLTDERSHPGAWAPGLSEVGPHSLEGSGERGGAGREGEKAGV